LFPLLEGNEFDALVEDVKAKGLLVPIVTHEGKILDGRNRYRACIKAGLDPGFEAYTGDDALAYLLSLNLERRHLNERQRAMVAAKLATVRHGQRKSESQICDSRLTQAEAADRMNVSKRLVESARVIRDKGTPELVRATEQGKVPVSLAEKIAAADA